MTDVAIVGAGLFGSIIARELRRQGHTVLLYDDQRPNAGSLPAACLMKPGWISGLGREVTDPALEKLDELYGVNRVAFKVGPKRVPVFWVPPSKILSEPFIQDTVKAISPDRRGWQLTCVKSQSVLVRKVVVAAGVWSSDLAGEQQRGLAGMAFLWKGRDLIDPFISVWAPYKQIVAFNRGDGLWVGDGTSIIHKNWDRTHEDASLRRCSNAIKEKRAPTKKLFGIRPYHPMKPCYFVEEHPGLWIASGGAKNGTLAAAWCAYELGRRLV
jgi:glycine/D-amino acid oxidase-like deaminating enzyme